MFFFIKVFSNELNQFYHLFFLLNVINNYSIHSNIFRTNDNFVFHTQNRARIFFFNFNIFVIIHRCLLPPHIIKVQIVFKSNFQLHLNFMEIFHRPIKIFIYFHAINNLKLKLYPKIYKFRSI